MDRSANAARIFVKEKQTNVNWRIHKCRSVESCLKNSKRCFCISEEQRKEVNREESERSTYSSNGGLLNRVEDRVRRRWKRV